ncbi:hypothetical protein [Methylobacterium sp. CM6247]
MLREPVHRVRCREGGDAAPALTNLSSRPTPDLRQLPPQRFHLGMELAGIHGQLDALLLRLRELGTQFGILGGEGEQEQGVGNGGPPMDRAGRGRRR